MSEAGWLRNAKKTALDGVRPETANRTPYTRAHLPVVRASPRNPSGHIPGQHPGSKHMDWLLAQMLTAARLPFPRSYCEKSSRHGDANSFEETPVFRRRRVIDNNNF